MCTMLIMVLALHKTRCSKIPHRARASRRARFAYTPTPGLPCKRQLRQFLVVGHGDPLFFRVAWGQRSAAIRDPLTKPLGHGYRRRFASGTGPTQNGIFSIVDPTIFLDLRLYLGACLARLAWGAVRAAGPRDFARPADPRPSNREASASATCAARGAAVGMTASSLAVAEHRRQHQPRWGTQEAS